MLTVGKADTCGGSKEANGRIYALDGPVSVWVGGATVWSNRLHSGMASLA